MNIKSAKIEIPHGRIKKRTDGLAEEEQSTLRSKLGELMRIARISRPGAIYDASGAARTFTARIIVDIRDGSEAISNTHEEENTTKK